MEATLLVVIIVIVLIMLMMPRSDPQIDTRDDFYEDYIAWRMARQAARNQQQDANGCFGLLLLALVVTALLIPLLGNL